MSQSQPLRIEDSSVYSFITSRTINSRLWFVRNKRLEDRILGYLAKYVDSHKVELYATNIQGNHVHIAARFPLSNRGCFMRDLNARTAEGVRFTVKEFEGGPLFERRYSEQALVESYDLEEKFFYCALQPVKAGLCQRISDYPGYNSFSDATSNIKRKYEVIDWAEYNKKKKYNPRLNIKDYTTYYELSYLRLPQYKSLSHREYKKLMLQKLEEQRQEIVKKRIAEGLGFLDPSHLLEVQPGSLPHKTKKSRRYDYRPLAFCKDPTLKAEYMTKRFGVIDAYKKASKAYLAGDEHVEFPPFTYKPPRFLVAASAPPA